MDRNPPPCDWLMVKQAPQTRLIKHMPPALLVGRFNSILYAVADAFATTPELIAGPRRDRNLVQARFAAVALVLELCPQLSLPDIAWLFGKRDHTTILHARKRAGELLHPDRHSAQWRARYQQARRRVTAP